MPLSTDSVRSCAAGGLRNGGGTKRPGSRITHLGDVLAAEEAGSRDREVARGAGVCDGQHRELAVGDAQRGVVHRAVVHDLELAAREARRRVVEHELGALVGAGLHDDGGVVARARGHADLGLLRRLDAQRPGAEGVGAAEEAVARDDEVARGALVHHLHHVVLAVGDAQRRLELGAVVEDLEGVALRLVGVEEDELGLLVRAGGDDDARVRGAAGLDLDARLVHAHDRERARADGLGPAEEARARDDEVARVADVGEREHGVRAVGDAQRRLVLDGAVVEDVEL
jgi:hypothetical protein